MSGIIAKVFDAFAKLFTIPLLIGFYGKVDYGLITLAVSLNAYLRIMDLGMNTGAIRYFSIWFSNKEHDKITKASQSSVFFYGIIGLINCTILVGLGAWAEKIFAIEPHQSDTLRWMLYMLALSAVIYWASYIINQLLIAYGEITWTNYSLIVSSILNLITVFIAIYLKLSLPLYFVLYVCSTLSVIPINLLRLRQLPISIRSILYPKWTPSVFNEILKYSLGIFAIGIFNYSADSLRPILLGIFSKEGLGVLTDYKIMSTIIMLVGSIGAVFLLVLLPIASKCYASNDNRKIKALIYDGTKYLSLFFSFLIFLLIVSIKPLLHIYVGEEYIRLTPWLSFWLVLMLYMHDFAISSVILSSGKTKILIYSSGTAAVLSLLATWLFIPKYEVGATVVGFAIFVIIQMLFNYLYYLPIVLHINSFRVFAYSFMPSVLIGAGVAFLTSATQNLIHIENSLLVVLTNSLVFTLLFGSLTLIFILRPSELKSIFNSTLNKA